MNFELKSLDLAGAASEKSDALLVLVTTAYKPGRGVLADLIAHAVKAGDLDTKAGKLLHAYRSAGVASPRVLLAGVGEGTVRQVRQSISVAMAAVKAGNVARLGYMDYSVVDAVFQMRRPRWEAD